MPEARPLRVDAARNRAKILEAANRQITARGPSVPMEAIAEDAGVAVGTLYRHFPTKDDLVRAVVESHLDRLADEAEHTADRVARGAPAFHELMLFARRIMDSAAGNHAVKAAARALGTDYDADGSLERGHAAMERVIDAGKASGELRSDLTLEDLHLFFATVPIDQPAPARERWFTLMMDGFRAPGAREPDGGPAAP